MNIKRYLLILAASLVLMGGLGTQSAVGADSLYIGDGADDTIKRYDAQTGAYLGVFVAPGSGGLHGPRGLLIDDGKLLVSNQNAGLKIPGEILRYDEMTGGVSSDLVPSTYKYAPNAPRGIILGARLYVADLLQSGNTATGRIRTYNTAGTFLGDLKIDQRQFSMTNFHPQAAVFAPDPDGGLYVSLRDLKHDGLGGHVLRFNSDGSFDRVFIADEGGVGHLNRPGGLVFGPDGNLYISSGQADSTDTGSIRIYSPEGEFLRKIDLGSAPNPSNLRAQSLLFGPQDCLFVPIFATGEVRRYKVEGLETCDAGSPYESFVPACVPPPQRACHLRA